MRDRVLITGGAGFIGFHLAKRLEEDGYDVCLADNHARGALDSSLKRLVEKQNVSLVRVDLLDPEETRTLGKDFSIIFHLAAIIGVRHVLGRPYEVMTQNFKMLENVIELGRNQSRLSRLFFASTSEVYAGTLKNFSLEIPTPETAPLALTALESPRTSYMLSKIMGEALLHQAELPFTIFRPHNIYGPRMGMAHVIPEQLRKAFDAKENSLISVYSPNHKRAFCYIDDAIEMLRCMILNPETTGATLNLGSESPEVSIREVVETCIEVVGKNLTVQACSNTEGSPSRRAPNMDKLSEFIDFKAKVTLREGIENTWDWYINHVFIDGGVSAQ